MKPTAAPAHWPYRDHRNMANVMRHERAEAFLAERRERLRIHARDRQRARKAARTLAEVDKDNGRSPP